MPIILLVFTQRYAPNLGQSDSLCCAPPTGGGFKVDGVGGVLGDGFTERFYTQTYCWENMTDYPVRDEPLYDEGNLPMQVYDDQKSDQIKPLILVKVNGQILSAFVHFPPPGRTFWPSVVRAVL